MSLAETYGEHPLVVSKKRAAKALDVSDDTIDRLIARGDLERVRVSDRRVGITWRSLLRLIGEAA